MQIYLDQLGCRLNYSEMETLASRLQAVGHTVVPAPEAAQVIVLNTCAVTAGAVSKSRQTVRQLHARNPQARIALTGCFASLEPQAAAALPGVALVAHNQEKERLPLLLEEWSSELDDPDQLDHIQPDGTPFDAPIVSASAAGSQSRTRSFIKVQDGCNNRCTFCIVTMARGDSRSRPMAEIVAEVQQLVENGTQEAVLTGVHLGSYGRDLASDLVSDLRDLVAALLSDTDLVRLRLSSLEPWELVEDFFSLWQRWPHRLCPHLHIPLQAGTDQQLRRMARRCTTATFRQLVQEARAAIPDLVITTDLIAGFPGESEADFAQGLAFVEEMRFAHAHIFPFSARPGTAAATFAGQVSRSVKRTRAGRLRSIVEQTGQAERFRFLGSVREVLWEGQGEAILNEDGLLWSGFTDNYLRVMAVAPAHMVMRNRITPVQLDTLDGETLFGAIRRE